MKRTAPQNYKASNKKTTIWKLAIDLDLDSKDFRMKQF